MNKEDILKSLEYHIRSIDYQDLNETKEKIVSDLETKLEINLSAEIRKEIEDNVEEIIDKICEEDIETSDDEEEVIGDNCEIYELCEVHLI